MNTVFDFDPCLSVLLSMSRSAVFHFCDTFSKQCQSRQYDFISATKLIVLTATVRKQALRRFSAHRVLDVFEKAGFVNAQPAASRSGFKRFRPQEEWCCANELATTFYTAKSSSKNDGLLERTTRVISPVKPHRKPFVVRTSTSEPGGVCDSSPLNATSLLPRVRPDSLLMSL